MINRIHRAGFALPIVLVSVAGLVILLIGMMALVQTERGTATKFSHSYRAELAAKSALAEVEGLMLELTSKDDYLVIKRDLQVESNGETHPRPYYYIAKPKGGSQESDPSYDLEPLFSIDGQLEAITIDQFREDEMARLASESPVDRQIIPLSDDESSDGRAEDEFRDEDALANVEIQPWQYEPIVQWQTIYEDKTSLGGSTEVPVARYAYWIEDMEGYIDATTVGNVSNDGIHERLDIDSPAPGVLIESEVNTEELVELKPRLSSAQLHTLFDGRDDDLGESEIDNRLISLRERIGLDESGTLKEQLGQDQILAFGESELPRPRMKDPTVRPITQSENDPRDFLENEDDRVLEENVTLLNREYEEKPLIPYLKGIDPSMMGEAQLNLNQLLEEEDTFVERFAEQIENALPDFADNRKGGFPEDYLKTLAAGAKDYADADAKATKKDGSYRGLDAAPIVSEVAFRIKKFAPSGGKIRMEGQLYLEVWNMTNQVLEGTISASYETGMSGGVGTDFFDFGADEILSDTDIVLHNLSKRDGLWSGPDMSITLQPNEYQVISSGLVIYTFNLASFLSDSQITLTQSSSNRGGYHLWWNGDLVDSVRGGLERFPMNFGRGGPRQVVNGNIPGHSHGDTGTRDFINNMGDPRMAYYIDRPVASNLYPYNWTPFRRNIKRNVFEPRNGERLIHGRVFPSEWPDGGHDTEFGNDQYTKTNKNINPDDPVFETGKPPIEPTKAPMYLSNLGRFYSETELGNIYDPVMWDSQTDVNKPERWLDIDEDAEKSLNHGGGNTLRISRAEHSRFDDLDSEASLLLDLFHAGDSSSEDPLSRQGPVILRNGHININTATQDALRVMVAGNLITDPDIAIGRPGTVDKRKKIPQVRRTDLGTLIDESRPNAKAAEFIAKLIVENRPYASLSEIVNLTNLDGEKVFGNKELYKNGEGIQWNDRAAEELFSRLYNSTTVRSRNFRVYVLGQSLNPNGQVLATHKRVVTLFADPGQRTPEGDILPENITIKHIHDRNY